jgi:hypothetical protein
MLIARHTPPGEDARRPQARRLHSSASNHHRPYCRGDDPSAQHHHRHRQSTVFGDSAGEEFSEGQETEEPKVYLLRTRPGAFREGQEASSHRATLVPE